MPERKHFQALVVCPHPDDGEFAAAGTVAKFVKEGKEIVYIICTNGDKGTSDPTIRPEQLAVTRKQEQREACRVLGVTEIVFLDYLDQALDNTAQFRKDIVRVIRKYKPEIVMCPDPYRKYIRHPDHRITGQVTLDAIFPYARDVHAYEDLYQQGLEPHKVKVVLLWGSSDVNYRIDITETFHEKLAALACHKSQIDYSPKFEARIRERCLIASTEKGTRYAESFHREKILR